jgi:hypothetical protein
MTLQSLVRRERREYGKDADEDLPLGTYAALTGGYVAATGLFALWSRRRGVRRTSRVSLGDVALLGVATFELSELVSRDRVTSFLRAPFTRYQSAGGGPAVEEEPRPSGLRKGIGDLVTCPWCTAQWVATALMCSYLVAPRVTRYVASGAAVVAAAQALEYARARVE